MRPLGYALTTVSLICCVLLLIAWPVSYWQPIEFASSVTIGGLQPVVEVSGGSLILQSEPYRLAAVPTMASYDPALDDLAAVTGGYSWMWFGYGGSPLSHVLWVPLWFPVILTAILPALWLWRWRKRRGGKGFPIGVTPDA